MVSDPRPVHLSIGSAEPALATASPYYSILRLDLALAQRCAVFTRFDVFNRYQSRMHGGGVMTG